MRYLLFIFLMGCTATAQNQSEDLKEDIEFQKLMNKVSQTNDLSVQVQAKASKKEAELVQKAVETLKELHHECHYDAIAIADAVKALLGKRIMSEV